MGPRIIIFIRMHLSGANEFVISPNPFIAVINFPLFHFLIFES